MENQNICLENAGLVILNNFIFRLFDRLGLLENERFKDANAQQKAILALQYLATGQTSTEDIYLAYNKVVCGLAPDAPINGTISFSVSEVELMENLIKAIIGYWSSIGTSSIEGFRGNWLVRNGLLLEKEDHWEVIVEKRAYDLLLLHAPFSYAIQKLPWMSKPIYVTWPI